MKRKLELYLELFYEWLAKWLPLSFLLFWPAAMLSQQPPPIAPATNTLTWCVSQNCFNETSNFIACQTVTNISTNGIPWSEGPYATNNMSWGCCIYCPDQRFYVWLSWTLGKQTFNTNWINTSNSTVFIPYYDYGTNTVTQYLSYHTDGNTLSFAHVLTGPYTWSGSPNYRQPVQDLSYRFVQGVSTDGSVNPVHLWATNEFWLNGVLYKKELVH